MPGPKCNVTFCTNCSGKLNNEGKKITFHRFPKNPELRNLWLERCKREGNWNVDYGYVCSEHFQKDDFKRDLQAELLGYKGRRKLKPNAFPCRNLPFGCEIIDVNSSEAEVSKLKREKERHEQLIEECLLTTKEEFPSSYDKFKKWYKENKKIKKVVHCGAEKSSNIRVGLINLPSNQRFAKEQAEKNAQLKRNRVMQRTTMEKIFLATCFDKPFSKTNCDYIDEEYALKAKKALLKACALAPKSYNRFAKRLNLPCKDVLLTWSNKNILKYK